MNITVTNQEHCRKQVRLEIPADRVRAETDKMASELAKQVKVPGFRPGRVPIGVIKTRFRKELRDEVVSHLLPDLFGDAVRDQELKIVGRPEIDQLTFGSDDSIDVTFSVEVAPDFDLAEYKGLGITKRVYKIRDQEIDSELEHLRQRHAELVPVEDRAAQAGDIVTIKLQGQVEQPADDGAQQDEDIARDSLDIELGEDTLEDFKSALLGTSPGQAVDFNVSYPDSYPIERLKGKRVHYAGEVLALRVREFPDLDDDFAAAVGEEFKTLEDLRAAIRESLENKAGHRTREELQSRVMEALVERNRFDVPENLVDFQIDSRMRALARQMAMQGIDFRKLDIDLNALRESHRERSEREVRGSFILEAIAEAEGMEVTDEELDKEITNLAGARKETPAALKTRLTKENALDSIKEQIKNRKALDLVIASAEIRTEEVEGLSDGAAGGEGSQPEGKLDEG